MRALNCILVVLFLSPSLGFAWEESSDESLKKTQEVLRDRKKREQAVRSSAQAQEAHQRAQRLFKTEDNMDRAYEMSAQAMRTLLKQANGDLAKAKDLLRQGLKDPEAFAESMPDSFKKLLRETASEVEKMQAPQRN